MKKTIRRIFIVILALITGVYLGLTIREIVQYRREDRANKAVAQAVREQRAAALATATPEPTATPVPDATPRPDEITPAEDPSLEPWPEPPAPEPTIIPWYEEAHQRNGDMAGWLEIEGTNIDYAVMYTPEEQDKYLHLGFDGSYAGSGSLFIGLPWNKYTNNTIIYGHNMYDGSMFGALHNYADVNYALDHRQIRFDTLYEQGVYEVFAAFYTQVHDEASQDLVFSFYLFADLADPTAFETFVTHVKFESVYDLGVTPQWGDQLLTLSTCDYRSEDGRCVVVAKRIA